MCKQVILADFENGRQNFTTIIEIDLISGITHFILVPVLARKMHFFTL